VLEAAVGKPQVSNSVYPVAPDKELRGKVQSSLRTLTGPDALGGPPLAAIGFSMTLEAREVFRDLLHAAIGLADQDGDCGRLAVLESVRAKFEAGENHVSDLDWP
jgi:hypothetical protein